MNPSLLYSQALPVGGQYLLDALSAPDKVDAAWRDAARAFGVSRLRSVAHDNRVECAVGEALGEHAGDVWAAELTRNEARVEALVALCAEVIELLSSLNVSAALFESGGVLCATHIPLKAFQSGDLDLLISPSDWARALEALASLGFESRERRSEGVHRAELHLKRAGHDLYLDIARAPFERMTAPLPFVDRTETWLSRRVPSPRFDGLYTLSPVDLLVQVAVHTSLHQYVLAPGLRLHMDVERVVRDHVIDWGAFVSEVDAVGLRTRAFVSLSMAVGLLRAAVPLDVLEALAPRSPRAEGLLSHIASEGVFDTGQPKLSGLSALRLDRMLDDRGGIPWLGGLLFPDGAWLRPRMERDGKLPGPDLLLHVHRARRLAKRVLKRG